MKTFNVVYETRQRGAIGYFSKTGWTVEMHQSSFSPSDVYRAALRQIEANNLEPRFPVSQKEVAA